MGGVCGISSTTVEILNQYLTLRGSETETKSTTVEILNQYLTTLRLMPEAIYNSRNFESVFDRK